MPRYYFIIHQSSFVVMVFHGFAIDAHFNYIQMALQMGNIDKRIAGVVEGYLSVQETNTALSFLAHVCSVLSKPGISHSQWLFSSCSKQQRVHYQGFSCCICAL